MALLKVKIPKPLCTNLWLASIFYQHYPKLRRIPLSKFIPIRAASALLNTDEPIKYFLINSRKFFAIEFNQTILIHPDAFMRKVRADNQRLLSRLTLSDSASS